jgi:hypothetical protein
MARQAPWRKEHHVDAYVIARPGKARSQHFGGSSDAAKAILVDRKVEIGGAVAPLHLDESDDAPAPCDEVDFARWHAQPLTKDAPAVQAQPPRRAAFGLAPARLGRRPLQTPSFSSSARA